MTNLMDTHDGAGYPIPHIAEIVASETNPPWHARHPIASYAEMSDFEHINEENEISREDIANSIRKFEELSKQLEERNGNNDEEPIYDGVHYEDRRMSLIDDLEYGRGIPLSYSLEDITAHGDDAALPVSEEERSKSDGETEELLIQREEEPINEEVRSKSDGEQGEEDDDDAVPLKIQAVAMNKGCKLLLSNSWLKTVPAEVWDLTHLTELDLSANYLKKISKSIGNLSLLKKLRLNHNQLSVLPKEIFTLTRLTALLLNNNSLKAIPKDIKNLTKLKTLDLSSNQINEIATKDGGLLHLTSLIELRLRNNSLTSVPIAIADTLTNLQVLWLEGNPLPLPKSITKKPANVLLSYIKDHPQSKGKSAEPIKPRTLRKSPPVVGIPGKSNIPHPKKDMQIIAEKELKKRKREQLEEMRKHMEVEKKVKLLEHELMLANAKALKFEEEVRKVEEQKLQEPPPASPIQQQFTPQPPQLSHSQPPSPFNISPIQFSQLPPHMPRQHGIVNSNNKQVEKNMSPHNFEWEIPFKELAFGPRIGRGGYGEVYRGMWGGTEVAIKMLFTDNMSAKLITDLRNEVELLCKLRHPNIVLFMGACTEPETPCIVTEYLGRGSLANILGDESVDIDWGLRLQIGIDCARGMAYLHSRHPVIIHRDLKTDNLLVDDNWSVKVADFGLATVKSRTFAKTMCGTTGWVAPEVLAEEGYTEKADVYSFAIILWEMLTRQIPYAGKNTMQVVRSVDRGERLSIPDNCPPDYAQLITDCWATDPAKRLSFAEILPRIEKMRANYLMQKAQEARAPTPLVTEPMALDGVSKLNDNNSSNNNNNNAAVAHTSTDNTATRPMSVDDLSKQNNNNNNNNTTTTNTSSNSNNNNGNNNNTISNNSNSNSSSNNSTSIQGSLT